jgi:hypothetical protein
LTGRFASRSGTATGHADPGYEEAHVRQYPAFDTYFKAGFRAATFGPKAFRRLGEFYQKHADVIERRGPARPRRRFNVLANGPTISSWMSASGYEARCPRVVACTSLVRIPRVGSRIRERPLAHSDWLTTSR